MSGREGEENSLVPLIWGEATEATEDLQRFVMFQACDEWFGLPIQSVREIHPLERVTRMPNAPAEILGILNLRGRILALFELGRCLGIPPGVRPNTHAVVVDVGDPELQVGFAVQRIAQIQGLAPSAIEPPPPREGGASGVEGLCELEGQVVSLLDPARVLARSLSSWGVTLEIQGPVGG
jgi:purine-binding chemotaxis protein CheW